jgi:hypothetical protein
MRIPEKFRTRNMLNLTELSLKCIDLGGKIKLMTEIKFLRLRILRVKSCINAGPLTPSDCSIVHHKS